jgi:zinc finger protein BrlA
MNSMAQDIPFGLLDMTIGFSSTEMLIPGQGMMGYDDFSTYIGPNGDAFSNHSSTSLESQSFDCNLFSPVSELGPSPAKDFVVPSQTTFMDTFDMNSPLRSTKSLQFSIQYNTPSTEYDSSFDLRSSPAESLKYFMSPNNEPRSCSTTPSRTSLPRQPAAELLQTSAALHHVQEQTHPSKRPQAERPTRRRIKQEARRSLLSSNITIQQLADNPCPWEGCNQKFQRREHLKRHLNDIHLKANCFPCIFCSHPFGRSDNLKTHLILHGDPDGDHKRTSYHPEARKVVEEMNRKSSRKRAGVKTDGVSSTKRRSRVTGS